MEALYRLIQTAAIRVRDAIAYHPGARKPLMLISLIAAMTENRVIGRDGEMPWHLPADLAHFKRATVGHHVIMGRRTIESFGRLLPGRTNIVLTRQPAYAFDGARIAHDLEQALRMAEHAGEAEAFICGGEAVYHLALPLAHRIYLTTIHATIRGDTYFPQFERGEWRCVTQQRREADADNEHAMTFRLFERI